MICTMYHCILFLDLSSDLGTYEALRSPLMVDWAYNKISNQSMNHVLLCLQHYGQVLYKYIHCK